VEELGEIPRKYVFEVFDARGEIVTCIDIRILIHLYESNGLDYVKRLLDKYGSPDNFYRFLIQSNIVDPTKGIVTIFDCLPTTTPKCVFQPITYDPSMLEQWKQSGGLTYFDYFESGIYIEQQIARGGSPVLVPKEFNDFLQERTTRACLGEPFKTGAQPQPNLQGLYLLVLSEPLVPATREQLPRRKVLANLVRMVSDEYVFVDMAGQEITLRDQDLLSMKLLQPYVAVELRSTDPSMPRTTYGYVANDPDRSSPPDTVTVSFPTLRKIWGSEYPPANTSVSVSAVILPIAAGALLKYATWESQKLISNMGEKVGIPLLEEAIGQLRIIQQGQNILIPTESPPSMENTVVMRIEKLYGYVRRPGSFVYEVKRVAAANTFGGAEEAFAIQTSEPDPDAPVTNFDYLANVFKNVEPFPGWYSPEQYLEEEQVQAALRGMQVRDISGVFSVPLSKQEMINLSSSPPGEWEKAHWLESLRGIAPLRERVPDILPPESKPGINILRDGRWIAALRYVPRMGLWYTVAGATLPPMTDEELIQYMSQQPDFSFFALSGPAARFEIVPKPPVLTRARQSPATFRESPALFSTQQTLDYVTRFTNIPESLARIYEIPYLFAFAPFWTQFALGDWRELNEINIDGTNALDLVRTAVYMMAKLNAEQASTIADRATKDPETIKFVSELLRPRDLLTALAKYYYPVVVQRQEPFSVAPEKDALLLREYLRFKEGIETQRLPKRMRVLQ
jgi:hypothetical protein